jgi:hypothetical protein
MSKLSKSLLALTLCVVIGLTACSTAWISQVEAIVAALLPAAANIIALISAVKGGQESTADLLAIQQAGSQAQGDLQLIQTLVSEYQKADASAQPGILVQVQTAISTAQANLQGILAGLHLKDAATQAKITAVIGVVLSEIESLSAIVPLVKPGASPAMVEMATKQAAKTMPLSANEFVTAYNKTMTAKTGNASLDKATASLSIHRHGKLERIATVGLLK